MNQAPTFFVIGAARSGTTWAWECLRHHPQVDVTVPKEVHFFNHHFERGEEWYLRHFSHPERPVRGEVNPNYLASPEAAERMASLYPGARLIVILREPRERTVSHIQFRAQAALGDLKGVRAEELTPFATSEMVESSLYGRNLKRFVEAFGSESITVLFYDDLRAEPEKFLADLYRTVGADESFRYDGAKKVVNQGKAFRFVRLFQILRAISGFFKRHTVLNRFREWFNRVFPLQLWLLERLKRSKSSKITLRFEDFYGPEENELLLEDLRVLQEELGVKVPEQWLQGNSHGSKVR